VNSLTDSKVKYYHWRVRKILLFFIALTLLFVTPSVQAGKDSSRKPEVTTLNAGETVNKDYFVFNERVEIFGTVNGDVYAGAGIVLVEGKINGDLIVGGGQVTINGEVNQDVRVGGGQVTIGGKIGRNLTVGGGSVEVTKGASIGGSVVAGAGNINLNAPVGGDIRIGAGNVTLSGEVGGDVEAWVGSLRLTPSAVVAGNITYWSTEDASIASGATVTGSVTKNSPAPEEVPSKEKVLGVLTGFALFLKLLSLFTLLVVGLILIKFFPVFNTAAVANLRNRPWLSFGVGALTLILVPVAAVVLMVTVVGVPLGLMLLAIYGIAIFLSRVFVVYLVGQLLLTQAKVNEVLTLLVGLAVYALVTLLPIIGGLTTFLATVFSLGALVLTKRDTYLLARDKKVV